VKKIIGIVFLLCISTNSYSVLLSKNINTVTETILVSQNINADARVVFDTTTRMEWLTWESSIITGGNYYKNSARYIENDGFRFATLSEVNLLFTQVGITIGKRDVRDKDFDDFLHFMDIFDIGGFNSTSSQLLCAPMEGITEDCDPTKNYFEFAGYSQAFTGIDSLLYGATYNEPSIYRPQGISSNTGPFTTLTGSWLVRQVPEPTTALLFAIGLLCAWITLCRKKLNVSECKRTEFARHR